MQIVHESYCGIDVLKKVIAANLLLRAQAGGEDVDEVRTFGTTTGELQ